MNRLESAWALQLEAMKRDGQILHYAYEPVTLKLGHDTRYTPDFLVVWAGGEITFDETKGWMRDDALVKLRVAARAFPYFTFRLVRKGKRGERAWSVEEVKA
jgi:hypothetical protein